MFKNYLKITWRSLYNNKLYSAINIGGLGIGMAVSFMLLLYVYNEFTYDGFHQNKNRIYKVMHNQPSNGEIYTGDATGAPEAAALQKDYPEIALTARVNTPYAQLFNYNNTALKINTAAADASFLDIFSIRFIKGNKRDAFKELASVIITKSAAKALFGNHDPIGQIVKMNGKQLVKVTAIIKNWPDNSSFKFNALISWKQFEATEPWIKDSGWGNNNFMTYALLKPGVDAAKLNVKLANFIARYNPTNKDNRLFLYPFASWHLKSQFKDGKNVGGSIEYVRLFLLLAIGILLIACINFMNLATARSERRSREVGIRKVAGARRIAIIWQFLGESIMTAFLSFLFAVVLVIALLPYFNQIIGKTLTIPYHNLWMWIAALMVTIVTGVLAGSYPALFLSSFKPVKVLKGVNKAGNKTLHTRQILVVIQFVFATCLIISSIMVYKQIYYIRNRAVGYSQNGLIEILPEGNLIKNFESFRNDMINTGAAADAALTSGTIVYANSSTWGVNWPGQLPGEDRIVIDQIAASFHFASTYGLKVIQGRDFATDHPGDSVSIMLNEAAVKLMRLKHPLGQIVKWQGVPRTVVGVVQNFVWGSPYEPVKPAIIGFNPFWTGSIGIRLNPKTSVSKSLAAIQAIYKKYNPEYPFEYKFVDEDFKGKFRTERLLGTLSGAFTVLAIIISCLGLFGLASFAAEQRKKEISIRKVLGAGISNLWFNLSREFLQLVFISFIIGSAISWYYMSRWLSHYTYRTGINVWVFVVTITISLVVCLLTVSWQAIKAALSNPVKNLKNDG